MQQPTTHPRSTASINGAAAASSMYPSTADIPTHRSSGESIPISEQLMQVDQAITITLQEIDANFAKSHQIITGKILPSIRKYGVASHNTWQGARFWHRFFETASDINLVPTYGEEDLTSQQEQTSASNTTQDQDASTFISPALHGSGREDVVEQGNGDLARQDDSTDFNELEFEEPPRLSEASKAVTARAGDGKQKQATWAPLESPYDHLKRHVESDFSTGQDVPHDMKIRKSQGRVDDQIRVAEQLSRTTPSKPNGGKLATQLLRTQHEERKKSARKVQATPRRGGTTATTNPFALGKEAQSIQTESAHRWNGIADLRKTPLSKVKAESRKGKEVATGNNDEGDESNDSLAWPEGMSPPLTLRMQVPRSRFDKTPAKEAARLVVSDLLKTVEGASPATRRRIVQDRSQYTSQSSRAATKGGAREALVSTPLKVKSLTSRMPLPTPPTVTKRFGRGDARFESPAGVSSSRLLDEDEDGNNSIDGIGPEENTVESVLSKLTLTQSLASIDRLLQNDDDDDDDDSSVEDDSESESEEEDDLQQHQTGRIQRLTGVINNDNNSHGEDATGSSLLSISRSIDQDTLFGIRDPSLVKTASTANATSTHSKGAEAAKPTNTKAISLPSATSSLQGSHELYQPINHRLYEQGTVYGGRPLLGDDREDTYSAPSPTPATAQSRRSK
ncbi:hypothetical protein CBS101457_004116 [Exobasidium rhododendri]|nr:hypothetical protein CBS101457_004116 [Exobasidium rhododendri]